MDSRSTEKFINIVQENHVSLAVSSSMAITAVLHDAAFGSKPQIIEKILAKIGTANCEVGRIVENNLNMPHQFAVSTFLRTFLNKLLDQRARMSLTTQVLHMLNPVFAAEVFQQVITRCTKRPYVHM